jgi:hypothetical protein
VEDPRRSVSSGSFSGGRPAIELYSGSLLSEMIRCKDLPVEWSQWNTFSVEYSRVEDSQRRALLVRLCRNSHVGNNR